MTAYDPFPRAPQTAQRINPCAYTRADRPASWGYVNLPAPNAPRVKFVGKGKKRVKRINYK